jgi:hypothetical protein
MWRRVLILAAAVPLSMASVQLLVTTPSGAEPSFCGIAARTVCATPISNQTEGFSTSDQPSVTNGVPLVYDHWARQGGEEKNKSTTINPGQKGYATSESNGLFTGTQGTFYYRADGVLAGKGEEDQVGFGMNSPYAGDPEAVCHDGTYLACSVGSNTGDSKDPHWPFTVTTRVVTVIVRNNLVGTTIRLDHPPIANTFVEDPAATSAATKDSIPYNGQAEFGGYRAVSGDTSLTLDYTVGEDSPIESLKNAGVSFTAKWENGVWKGACSVEGRQTVSVGETLHCGVTTPVSGPNASYVHLEVTIYA